MKKHEGYTWLGSTQSFETAVEAFNYFLDNQSNAKAFAEKHREEVTMNSPFLADEDDYEPFFDIIDEQGKTGVINITGSLVAEDSWVNAFFGLTSYESIINAASFFLQSDDITNIALNIDSGGGEVAGLEAAGEALKAAAEIKPVQAHVNGSAGSAAYWLASSANSINATRMSEVGSIGVLLTHKAMYRALDEAGVDVTLITAGKYKGLGHPAKPLSDSDKVMLQEKADTLYSFFLEKVTSERPQLSIVNKDAWAEGRTFFAEEGLALGLVDSVASTDMFFKVIDKQGEQTNNTNVLKYSQENPMPKSVLLKSEQTKAALESGADLASLEHEEVDVSAAEQNAVEKVDTEVSANSTEGKSAEATAEGDDTSEVVTNSEAPSVVSLDTLLSKVATLTEANAELKAAASVVDKNILNLEENVKDLKTIAIEATHKMQIGLNSEPLDLDDMPVATVVAQYQKVRTAFNKSYKVGQVSRAADISDEGDQANALKLGIVPKS